MINAGPFQPDRETVKMYSCHVGKNFQSRLLNVQCLKLTLELQYPCLMTVLMPIQPLTVTLLIQFRSSRVEEKERDLTTQGRQRRVAFVKLSGIHLVKKVELCSACIDLYLLDICLIKKDDVIRYHLAFLFGMQNMVTCIVYVLFSEEIISIKLLISPPSDTQPSSPLLKFTEKKRLLLLSFFSNCVLGLWYLQFLPE